MAKSRTAYTCSECGATSARWSGQCPDCKAWNTMVESVVEPQGVNRMSQTAHKALA
ncbi:MAG: DNA repair protein RadA, partial [Lysobacteraceae bacterium]